jgi:3-oxosteroid 1-dehydrogenase
MQSLLHEDGKVTGIIVMREGKPVAVRARKGVMLAAGGFERNQAMREKYLPLPSEQAWTATPLECNTGQAIEAGAKVGGALHMMTHTWGVPTLKVENEEKFRGVFVERSMPGCLVVNENGVRFVNESCPYPEFQQAMFANHAKTRGTIHVWIVFDAEFRQKYPMGPLLPGESFPDKKLPTSWLGKQYWRDETIGGLARQTGINEQGLIASVKKFNEFARTGKDLDFGRGGNDYDRYYGDDSVQPNPNLARLSKGPYYAMQLFPGDIGTKGGLLTDMDGQVLDDMGQVISGLFCTGNNAASVMGPSYPGAGATLGASMTFAYRAVARMAGKPIALKRKDLLGT